MPQTIFQVDAFTNQPYRGNPAAVCLLPEPADEDWMQNVAREMGLSETAFLVPFDEGYNLRWFTPATEVDLCGHATLASAHILWETGRLAPTSQAHFQTRSGLLTARRNNEWIELDFPVEKESAVSAPAVLIDALQVKPNYVGRNRFDYLVEVNSEETVRKLEPNLALLKTVPCRGVIVTSRTASPDFDFVSRFFAPNVGIDEDPVTGSAHCCLGPYWSTRLKKDSLTAYQASPRGGVVRVELNGDRVLLCGQSVTVLRGELL
jgi:PhzF family phenazine biosynthesis protein